MCLEEETSGMENGGRDRRVWFCMYTENLGYVCLSAKTGMCVSVCGVTGVSMWRERWGWCRDRDVCVCVTGEMWVLCGGRYAGRFRQAVEGEMSVCFVCMWKDGFLCMYVCRCVWRDLGVSVEGEMGMSVCLKDWVVHLHGEMRVCVFGEMGDMQRWVCVHG